MLTFLPYHFQLLFLSLPFLLFTSLFFETFIVLAMPSLLYTLVLLLPAVVSAGNDWSQPCLDGACAWDAYNASHPNGAIGSALHIVRYHSCLLSTPSC